MKQAHRIAITSGDLDGIGLEISLKALARLKPQRGVQFFLWRSAHGPTPGIRSLDRSFRRIQVRDWSSALQAPLDYHKTIVEVVSSLPPAKWVETMAKAGVSKSIDALVTAPLSKTEIHRSGMKDMGHTDILKRVTKQKDVFMTFLGREFNVVLTTGHVPIKKVTDQWNEERLSKVIPLAYKLRDKLSAKSKNKPLGLVGLNPHAGESGLIGNQESESIEPLLKKIGKKYSVEGPLVPDVCFQKSHWKKYSFYLASYHDQGLIPFKMTHGNHSGVQLSLGLPFLRTSVDHGTAKDIFGRNRANSGSMEDAIKVAMKILKDKPITW